MSTAISKTDIYLTFLSLFAPANAGIASSGLGLSNSSYKRRTVNYKSSL
jgi:hypothetical protein